MNASREGLLIFDGHANESVFTKVFGTIRSTHENNKTQPGLMQKLEDVGDQRSLVLTSALLCEYYLDSLLREYFPKYNILEENSRITFATKIDILKALNVIPSHIITCVNIIRQIRNEFAHDLDVDDLEKLPAGRINALKQLAISIYGNETRDESVEMHFKRVSWIATCGMNAYQVNIEALSQFVNSGDLQEFLHKKVIKEDDDFFLGLTKTQPLEEGEQNGIPFTRYEYGVVVVGNPQDLPTKL